MCILCLGNSSECFATKDRQPSHEPTAGRQGAQRKCPVIYVWLMSLRSVLLWRKAADSVSFCHRRARRE